MNIPIIYEDENILAVNKPAGLLVHNVPSSKFQELSLVDWLVEKYPEIKKVGDPSTSSGQDLRPGIVHRLDKDTSGVLLVAKNQKSFEYLKSQFQDRKIKKKYIALVDGKLKAESGTINLPIAKSKSDFRKKTSVGKMVGKEREATTEYKVIKRFEKFTLIEAYPKTGRTHQIRVHFKAIGHPIVCDKLYGPKKQICPFGLTRQFLHANALEFSLPDGSILNLETDLPKDLQTALDMLHC
ncbi:MAG: RluA family pseudouridine synthase [Candidatus Paceibacterota bacterium]